MKDPILVDATLAGVRYRYAHPEGELNRIYASCELAVAMHDTAQIAAVEGVTDIIHLGVYNCRVKAGGTELSEHAHANAIDIAGIVFDNGDYWTVYDDWEDGVLDPVTASGGWLKWFANELYLKWIFNIVITPEYDDNHDDHLHCDLTPGSHSID